MKNNFKFLMITALAAVVAVVVIGSQGIVTGDHIASLTEETIKDNGAVAGVQAEGEAQLLIDYGAEQDFFQFDVDQETTAYDLLVRASIRENIPLNTTDYPDLGILIDGIGNYQGGTDNLYWFLYVDGKMSEKSADNTMVSPGEKVEFKFEESQF